MKKAVRSVGRAFNALLGPLGLVLKRVDSWSDDTRSFIPFEETLAAARAAGQSVGDFIDARYNHPGATQHAVEQMQELGAFRGRIETVCEIGPGSGRYLEKVVRLCHPTRYEIYETAQDWAAWLVATHGVVRQPCDGRSLRATPDASMDLVHAHKVFPATPTLVSCHYIQEMARVVKPGGKVVFDAVTERCLDGPTLDRWLSSDVSHGGYPAALPSGVILEMLSLRRVERVGSFLCPMEPGVTECMVFIKQE